MIIFLPDHIIDGGITALSLLSRIDYVYYDLMLILDRIQERERKAYFLVCAYRSYYH